MKFGWQNLELYLTSMWGNCNCLTVWVFLSLVLFFGHIKWLYSLSHEDEGNKYILSLMLFSFPVWSFCHPYLEDRKLLHHILDQDATLIHLGVMIGFEFYGFIPGTLWCIVHLFQCVTVFVPLTVSHLDSCVDWVVLYTRNTGNPHLASTSDSYCSQIH